MSNISTDIFLELPKKNDLALVKDLGMRVRGKDENTQGFCVLSLDLSWK